GITIQPDNLMADKSCPVQRPNGAVEVIKPKLKASELRKVTQSTRNILSEAEKLGAITKKESEALLKTCDAEFAQYFSRSLLFAARHFDLALEPGVVKSSSGTPEDFASFKTRKERFFEIIRNEKLENRIAAMSEHFEKLSR